MTVFNISPEGIGFGISGDQMPMVGQRLELRFTLDNRQNTQVKKNAVVKSVCNDMVGCQFDEDDTPNGAFGFYLRT